MGTNKHFTAQGLYTSNHIGSVATDIGSVATDIGSVATDIGSTKFAKVGSNIGTTTYIDRLELKMYKQSIRIIQLENKLDSEECKNLKKMLESNDEASVLLAKEIIDNVE